MKTKSNELPTAKIRKVRFYTKASFPWAILFTLFIMAISFIGGFHTGQAHEQSMAQSFKNGVASVPKE